MQQAPGILPPVWGNRRVLHRKWDGPQDKSGRGLSRPTEGRGSRVGAQSGKCTESGGMCNCCGCCCENLKAIKLHPHPSSAVKSNYFAEVDRDLCVGCETCLERCQMEAIIIQDEGVAINLNRCIRCGLCVTTCPTKALSLRTKSPQEHYVPPPKPVDTYLQIAKERGKL